MKTKHHFSKFVSILFVLGLMLSNTGSAAYAQEDITPAPERVSTELSPTEPSTTGFLPVEGETWSQSGWFSIIWGDGPEGESRTVYTLTDDSGLETVLLIDETLAQSLGGVLSFNRKYVRVQGVGAAPLSDQGMSVLNVTSIVFVPSPGAKAPDGDVSSPGTKAPDEDVWPAVIGSKPWVSIMCKFSDYTVEPENLAFFQGMYANIYPRLDHYWRELSYNIANVAGSNASGWFVLPHTEAYYNPTDTTGGTDLSLLANDCIASADSSVDFSLYTGINMMFNTDFDNGYAWGGSRYMTLDGVSKTWSTTWEPPWAYADISVIQHEMGHGFGLPHSSGAYGATYDNAWDVMSDDRYNCAAATDPTYGCTAQHTISYHKDILAWIPAGQKFTAVDGTNATITLERLALPTTSNYKMVQIPIGGSSTYFYTVEARRLNGYDDKLAGNAVIIHEVDTTRSRPAYVIDPDLNGDTADAGAMWTVGETFSDIANNISVSVISATSTGFQVGIANGASGPPIVYTINPSASYSYVYAGNKITTWTHLDDGYFDYALGGFDFQFYGAPVTNVRMSTNGYITFGTDGTDFSNDPIPHVNLPNDLIAPFWDDLTFSGITGDAGGYWELSGTAPNRKLVFEWYQIPYLFGSETYSFELILYESTDRIKFQYLDVDSGTAYDFGAGATVGVENSDGTRGSEFSYNTGLLYNTLAIEFVPTQLVRCDFNGDGKTDILWRNQTTGQNSAWFMNGTALTGAVSIFTQAPPWQIVGPK